MSKILKKKFIRISTVPSTLNILLKNQLSFLNRYFDVIALSSNGNDLLEVQKREGVKIKAIEFKRQISFLKDLKSLILLTFYFLKVKPDIIQSNTPKSSLISMIAGFIASVKKRIYLVTGLRYESEIGFKRKILIYFEKLTCFFASQIIAESTGVKELLLKDKITNKEIIIIGNGNINGIDLSYWNPELFDKNELIDLKKDLKINNSVVFLFVGRLVGDKGVNELVEVFISISKESNKNIKLLLIGDFEDSLDSLLPHTKYLINSNANIIRLSFQEDIRKYLLVSDCLILPSYREGFSNVSLQAGSMGLPIIITDVNGATDLVQPGINGLIIKKYSKIELYNSIKLFTENKIKLDPDKIREIIIERYSQEKLYNKLIEFYNNL
jgi:glycosyltransferase involved in cell wall biosynthesis